MKIQLIRHCELHDVDMVAKPDYNGFEYFGHIARNDRNETYICFGKRKDINIHFPVTAKKEVR